MATIDPKVIIAALKNSDHRAGAEYGYQLSVERIEELEREVERFKKMMLLYYERSLNMYSSEDKENMMQQFKKTYNL